MVCIVCHQGCKHKAKFENFRCCHKGYSTKLLIRTQTWIPDKDWKNLHLQELPVTKLKKIVQRKKWEWTTTKLANKLVCLEPQSELYCVPLQIEWKHC